MNRDNRAKIIFAVIIIILLIILGVLGIIIFRFFNSSTDVSGYKKGTSSGTSSSSGSESAKDKDGVSNPVDFSTLKKTNPEIFGWLYVPDTNIDYPLLQSRERDDYYLHSDIYGNYLYAGSLYTEVCNSTDMDDRVTVIYGHNMIDGSMFANLHKFRDTDFFNKHSKFYIYAPNRKLTYQIVSAYEYDDRHLMNTNNYFSNNKVFKEYLDFIRNPRSISSNVRKKLDHKLTTKDKIVTLSTCLDSGDGRYHLQGVLVKDESTR